jgi:hypothetical protein
MLLRFDDSEAGYVTPITEIRVTLKVLRLQSQWPHRSHNYLNEREIRFLFYIHTYIYLYIF